MRCIERCGEQAEPGGARCASCSKWWGRLVASQDRDRNEQQQAAGAALVADVAARRAGQGRWRCLPTCRLCAEGSVDQAEQRAIGGRLFTHATRPAPPVSRPRPVGQLI